MKKFNSNKNKKAKVFTVKGVAALIIAAILAVGLLFTGCPNSAGGSGSSGGAGSTGGTGGSSGGGTPPADKTYTVGGVQFTMKGIAAVTNGTVFEWCWDWYRSTTPTGGQDPAGGASGTYRVARGGSWSSIAIGCTVGARFSFSPGSGDDSLGFRLACRP